MFWRNYEALDASGCSWRSGAIRPVRNRGSDIGNAMYRGQIEGSSERPVLDDAGQNERHVDGSPRTTRGE
jgi:hypothetical protein